MNLSKDGQAAGGLRSSQRMDKYQEVLISYEEMDRWKERLKSCQEGLRSCHGMDRLLEGW